MQCERTRAIAEQSRILLLGTNHPIVTYQGNPMDTGLRRYDGVVCGWGSIFYAYCATMGGNNFKDPIPACAGMTRSENCFLFYGHCSNLCRVLLIGVILGLDPRIQVYGVAQSAQLLVPLWPEGCMR